MPPTEDPSREFEGRDDEDEEDDDPEGPGGVDELKGEGNGGMTESNTINTALHTSV